MAAAGFLDTVTGDGERQPTRDGRCAGFFPEDRYKALEERDDIRERE